MKKNAFAFIWFAVVLFTIRAMYMNFNELQADSRIQEEKHIQKEWGYYQAMIKNWFITEEIALIKNYCKKVPNWWNFHRCLSMTTAIKVAEQWKSTTNRAGVWFSHNNLFSFKGNYGFKEYDSRIESIHDFMGKYNTLWYKNNCTEMMTKSNYLPYNENRKYNCLYTIRQFDHITQNN